MARVRPIGTIVQSRRYRPSCEGCPRPELRLRKVSPIQIPASKARDSDDRTHQKDASGCPPWLARDREARFFLDAKVVATSVAGLIAVEKSEDGRSRLDCDWSSSAEEVRTLREVLDSRSPPTVPESWYEWRALAAWSARFAVVRMRADVGGTMALEGIVPCIRRRHKIVILQLVVTSC